MYVASGDFSQMFPQFSSFWTPSTIHHGNKNPFPVGFVTFSTKKVNVLTCHLFGLVFSSPYWFVTLSSISPTNIPPSHFRRQSNFIYFCAWLKKILKIRYFISSDRQQLEIWNPVKSPSFDEKSLPYVWKPSSHINWIYWTHTKQNNFLRSSLYSSGFKGFGFQMFLTRFWLFF